MSALSKMTWSGMAGGIILLGFQQACLAEPEDTPPAVSVAAAADQASNPYSVIADRNVFHLNPLPPPPETNKPPPANLPALYLSGFMRMGDQLKVLLVVKVPNPAIHGQQLASYLTLAEGDKKTVGSGRDEVTVELVKADAAQEKVDIINAGTPVTLTMKKNALNSPPDTQGARNPIVVFHATPTAPTPPAAEEANDNGTTPPTQ